MERLQTINPDRIQWCCADRKIGVEDLAAETGISYTTIERTLNQDPGLTFKQLQKLANYFGRGVLFFLESEPVNEEIIHTTNFRTLENQKPALSSKTKAVIERAEKQRDVYLNLLAELNLEEERSFFPLDVVDKSPVEAAAATRDWLAIGESNTFEGYRNAIEAKGILVFRSNGYNGKWQIPKESPILGFSLYHETCPLIVVRKQNSIARQVFTLAHELGHILLHKSSSIDDDSDFRSTEGAERDANQFAANFLVPSIFLDTIVDAERPLDVSGIDGWLREYGLRWGVSIEVILLRLLDHGRLHRSVYLNYLEWRDHQPVPKTGGGTRAYRHREPKHLFGDNFVQVVLDSLDSRKITLTRASRYLDNLSLKDLHRLTSYYAGT